MTWRIFFLALKHRFARSQEAVYATTLQSSTLAKKDYSNEKCAIFKSKSLLKRKAGTWQTKKTVVLENRNYSISW
jgi:hypothetical protein